MSGLAKLNPNDPARIGPYEIVARLGSGGMGVVFLGTLGSKRVAIKIVRSSFLDSPSLRTRFEREIETLRKIDSPRVARFLDSSVEDEIAWHAVEFVNGPTLSELVKSDGPLDEPNWWRLARQLMEALESIHKLGVIHRDIKPSNLIITDNGLSLIDFGISQDADATSLTSTGMVAGSPAWLAPEQLEGTEISPATDLFSAGSVLVFAAKGNSPWGSETSMTIPVLYQRILTSSPDLSGLSDEQVSFLKGLLHSDPKQRKVFSLPDINLDSEKISTNSTKKTDGSTSRWPKKASSKAAVSKRRKPVFTLAALVVSIALAVPALYFVSGVFGDSTSQCSVIQSEREKLINDFQTAYDGGNAAWGESKEQTLASARGYRDAIRVLQPAGSIRREFLEENIRLSTNLISMLESLGDKQPFVYAYGPEYRKLLNHSVNLFDEWQPCYSD